MKALYADAVLIAEDIITMDRSSSGNAIAVRDGKILYVGSEEEASAYIGDATAVYQLRGYTITPGFVDVHTHPMEAAMTIVDVDLRPEKAPTVSDVLKIIAQAVQTAKPGQWIRTFGLNPKMLAEGRYPTLEELDSVSPDNPVYNFQGHVAQVNSLGLKLTGISETTPDPKNGHIERDPQTGHPNGVLREWAKYMPPVTSYDVNELGDALVTIMGHYNRYGVTSAGELVSRFPEFTQALIQTHLQKKNTVRIELWPKIQDQIPQFEGMLDVGLQSGFGDDELWLGGAKIFIDGTTTNHTACYLQDYGPAHDTHPETIYGQEAVNRYVLEANRHGLRVAGHCWGDAAFERLLRAYENAAEQLGDAGTGNRIEHCSIVSHEQMRRAKKAAVHISLSGGAIYRSDSQDPCTALKDDFMPAKSFLAEGLLVASNTDYPYADINPMLHIYGLVTRKNRNGDQLGVKEALLPYEAMQLCTINGAKLMHKEGQFGSISVGKYADFAVLDKNPLRVAPDEIRDIRNVMTFFSGKPVFDGR